LGFGEEPAVGYLEDTVAERSILFRVGDLDDGGAAVVKFFEQLHDLFTLGRVEIACGFIGED